MLTLHFILKIDMSLGTIYENLEQILMHSLI